jgi:hypothetical protein
LTRHRSDTRCSRRQQPDAAGDLAQSAQAKQRRMIAGADQATEMSWRQKFDETEPNAEGRERLIESLRVASHCTTTHRPPECRAALDEGVIAFASIADDTGAVALA